MTGSEYQSAARVKRSYNQPLNLRELSAAYGLKYARARSLSLQAGFPMVRGLIFPQAFEAWMAEGPRLHSSLNPPQNDAGKGRAPGSRSGSRVAWQQLAQCLRVSGSLPA